MLHIHICNLIKAAPILFLAYALQASAEVTTSDSSKHLFFRVPVNKSLLINLDHNFNRLTKGNDSIADITVFPPRQLLIRGKSIGGTNATILDANNRALMVIDLEVTHNLDALKQKIHELLPNEHIEVRAADQCIVLSGEVSNIVNMDYAYKIAMGYAAAGMQGGQGGAQGRMGGCNDTSTGGGGGGGGGGGSSMTGRYIVNMMRVGGEQQVMLEVKIAEVSRTLARALRLDKGRAGNFLTSRDQITGSDPTQDGAFIWSVLAAGAGAFTGAYVSGDTLFSWSLAFSRTTDLATILAEPNLSTLSGKKASFLSGGEFPYTACTGGGSAGTTTGGGSTVNVCNVNFKPFGVGLEFTPVVLDSSRINLSTHVSVSSLSSKANDVIAAGAAQDCGATGILQNSNCSVQLQSTPSLDTREAASTLELADGQTMSIAGLISENKSNKQEQTPGLADIPVLGSLFRNRGTNKEQKELVILVTPHLAKPIPPSEIRLPTDNYVEPDDIEFYLLGRMESRKKPINTAQSPVFDPTVGGTTGQFGHQLNEEGMQ